MTAPDPRTPHSQRLTLDASKVRRWGGACALLSMLIAAHTSVAQGDDSDRLSVNFRMPHPVRYQLDPDDGARLHADTGGQWIRAVQPGATNSVLLGSRIAVRTAPGIDLSSLVDPTEFPVVRELAAGWDILQAPNARTAVLEAERLAGLPEIQVSYPVMRQALRLHDAYVDRPNDTYFDRQWNLENRATDGSSLGVDLNLRAAWSSTRGAGVALAVVDDGIDLEHPEFFATRPTISISTSPPAPPMADPPCLRTTMAPRLPDWPPPPGTTSGAWRASRPRFNSRVGKYSRGSASPPATNNSWTCSSTAWT